MFSNAEVVESVCHIHLDLVLHQMCICVFLHREHMSIIWSCGSTDDHRIYCGGGGGGSYVVVICGVGSFKLYIHI